MRGRLFWCLAVLAALGCGGSEAPPGLSPPSILTAVSPLPLESPQGEAVTFTWRADQAVYFQAILNPTGQDRYSGTLVDQDEVAAHQDHATVVDPSFLTHEPSRLVIFAINESGALSEPLEATILRVEQGFQDRTGANLPDLACPDVTAVALGDLNNNGLLDIVYACAGSSDGLLLAQPDNDGDGVPQYVHSPLAITGATSSSVALSDLDGDGLLDIIVGRTLGETKVLQGQGGATLAVPLDRSDPTVAVRAITVADLDMNGRLDIILATQPIDPGLAPLEIHLNQGLGPGDFSFLQVDSPIDGVVIPRSSTAVAAIDVFHDGPTDVITANGSGSPAQGCFVQEMNLTYHNWISTPGLWAPLTATSDYREVPSIECTWAMRAGHLDDDGILDLAFGHATGLELLTGTGGIPHPFKAPTSFTFLPPEAYNNQISALDIADLNGDGQMDLIVGRYGGPSWASLREDTSFGEPWLLGEALTTVGLMAGDLGGNGTVQVVMANGPGGMGIFVLEL